MQLAFDDMLDKLDPVQYTPHVSLGFPRQQTVLNSVNINLDLNERLSAGRLQGDDYLI